MRVLHLIAPVSFGGGEALLAQLVSKGRPGLSEAVCGLYDAPRFASALAATGTPFLPVRRTELGHGAPRGRMLRDLLADPAVMILAMRVAHRFSADLIHAHGFPAVAVAAALRAWRPRLAVVYTHHFVRAVPGRLEAAAFAPIYAACHRLTGVSGPVCRTMEAAFPSLSGRMIHIPNAVADAFWNAAPDPRWALPTGRRIVVHAARFLPFKNQRLVVDALHRLDPALRDRLCVVFAGDGPERTAVESAAGGLGDAVRFPGAIDHADLPGLVARADFGLFPSEEEGFGIAAAECLAAGKPVLALDNRLMQEVIGDGGVLVPRDRLDLGFAELLARGDGLREAARQKAGAYRLDRIRDAYLAVYHEARACR